MLEQFASYNPSSEQHPCPALTMMSRPNRTPKYDRTISTSLPLQQQRVNAHPGSYASQVLRVQYQPLPDSIPLCDFTRAKSLRAGRSTRKAELAESRCSWLLRDEEKGCGVNINNTPRRPVYSTSNVRLREHCFLDHTHLLNILVGPALRDKNTASEPTPHSRRSLLPCSRNA
jgi:hypothetical protein